jgi:hypothetical protein
MMDKKAIRGCPKRSVAAAKMLKTKLRTNRTYAALLDGHDYTGWYLCDAAIHKNY